MAVNLSKGGNIDLTKQDPGLKNVLVGLGWDPRATDGASFDLDASLFMVDDAGKSSEAGFIYYNNLKSACGSVEHLGDNTTGEGDGDDELVKVDLSLIPANIQKIVFVVTIHDFDARKQNFGMVGNSFIRVLNDATSTELTKYELGEDFSTETALIFGELYRHNDSWKFRAVGQGYEGGLAAMLPQYGLA